MFKYMLRDAHKFKRKYLDANVITIMTWIKIQYHFEIYKKGGEK